MEKQEKMNRRDFIKDTTSATVLAMTAPMFLPNSAKGANDKIRVAVLGVNGRGKDHIKGYMNLENVEVVTLCDPDKIVLEKRAQNFKEKYNKKITLVQDLRKVYDDKNIDVVSIATCNHWHA